MSLSNHERARELTLRARQGSFKMRVAQPFQGRVSRG